ncbi:DUF4334 domain-containing protein [Rhodococcus sp. Q]|uniref:DUF4334 domain-containing protein n=1 Tax=Rhodococcus sp. Q TaxID=2502252 RepID=UPI0010F6BF31|nr:DUF4334 domain-containing protein [Rhodococcus sp. Q]
MSVAERIIAEQRATVDEAQAVFDDAPPADPDFLIGTWRGAELRTGHKMDGMLDASGWWGKQFVDAETVHPLLFPSADGRSLWALDPQRIPFTLLMHRLVPSFEGKDLSRLVATGRPVVSTRKPKARLRSTRFRGVDTATMIYDAHPINDVFRRVSDDTVIGWMDLRGSERPYFFSLTRDESLPVVAGSR